MALEVATTVADVSGVLIARWNLLPLHKVAVVVVPWKIKSTFCIRTSSSSR
jgi:hypothetical protein